MAETYRPILADAACHIDHLGPLGDILTEAGHLGEARAVRRFEAEHYRAVGDLHRARRAQLNLAVVTYRHGDGDEALSLYRELLGLCRATNDLDELQACHGNLGNVFLDRGDDTNALLQYEMQETLCGRLGIEEGLQASLGNQGNVWRKRGRFATALAKYRKQEEICRRTRNDIGLLNSLNSQTGILLETGEISPPEAMRRLKEFERQARELGLAESLLLNLERQASLLERNVDLEGALQRRQEAEAIAGRGLSREAQGDFYYRMACSLLGTGDELGGPLSGVSDLSALEKQSRFFGRRLEYDETGVGYLRKAIEYHPQHAEAHFALGLALERQRRLGEAAEAYETALRLRPGWTDAKIRLASVLVDLEET